MQTRDYKDLFRLITSMIGTGGELPGSGTEDTQVADFINRRFQQAFDESPIWPRYFVPSEERELISISLSGVSGTDDTDLNSNYAFLGKTVSAEDYGGITINPNTDVWYSKDSATVPDVTTVGATISNATVIYQQQNRGSGDPIRWVVRTGATITYFYKDDGTIEIDEISDGNRRLMESSRYDDSGNLINAASPLDVIKWTRLSGITGIPKLESKQYVPFSQNYSLDYGAGSTIGEFIRIHRKKAFVNNPAIEYEFFVDSNGANLLNIPNSADTSAFVSYKKQFTPFTVTSDFYNSTEKVPGEFFNFIAHAVYADFLRVQNRQQEAIAEEQVAQTYLALELEKIDIRSNNNTVNKRFSTYVNRQAR
jgi:hypothetical protein